MTVVLKKHAAYRRYLELGKTELTLPAFDTSSTIKLFVGEAYCRFPGCSNLTMMTTNNLRKHVKKHKDAQVADGGNGGGIACDDIDRALVTAFYQSVIRDYDNHVAGMTSSTPVRTSERLGGGREVAKEAEKIPLPMRKDGKAHNITAVKAIVKGQGLAIPCASCRRMGNPCCKDLNNCSYQVMFAMPAMTSQEPVMVDSDEGPMVGAAGETEEETEGEEQEVGGPESQLVVD
ncbi:hypothetical protein ACJ73_06467 [Blastomyces percursus]|uniref:Uncharacterized protein n=1 Tax=Blastomyces percursus TaxID=1658174 RepID=A0A1J9R128_9EURO|nr:hypothetical protein ACJ73_06467 [Blastomyces percursus]